MDIKKLYGIIDLEISITKDQNKTWINSPDYKEGFLDGLHRAKEVIDEYYPPVVSPDQICERGNCKAEATNWTDGDKEVCFLHV